MKTTPFDPYLPAEFLLRGQEWIAQGLPHAEPVEGAVLFADVSGFTAMSERLLATLGRQGAEVLTSVLNRFFELMIAEIHGRGGTVQKFGGDALTVLFEDEPERAVRRAVAAATAMQRAMGELASIETPAGVFSLAMKIGIGAGAGRLLLFGDPERRLDFAVEGPPVDASADAEHHAGKGDVVLDPSAAALFGGEGTPRGDGYLLIANDWEDREPAQSRPTIRLGRSLEHPELFLATTLRSRILSGDALLVNEHRRAAFLFVRFPSGYEEHEARVRLQDFYLRVGDVLDQYGGVVAKVDFGDKGAKFLALFGAPVAVEQAEESAVRAALAIAAAGRDTVGEVGIGINAGPVFAGDVGARVRREYTVMGDAVNLTARLMQKAAHGTILASETVFREVPDFDWDEIEPFAAKGKSEPVRAAIPKPKKRPTLESIPVAAVESEAWVPRPAIEERFARALDEVAKSEPSLLLALVAPAGGGKSALLDRLAGETGRRGIAVSRHRVRPWERNVLFGLGRSLLPELLGLPQETPTGRLEVRLRMALREVEEIRDQDLDALLALLGWRRGRAGADSEEEIRSRIGLFATVLDRVAGEAPRVILIDGGESLDFASLELLGSLRTNARHRLLVVAARTSLPELGAEELEVPPLARDEISTLLALLVGDDRIDAKLLDFVERRTAGNPLYVRSLLEELRESGAAAFEVVSQQWVLDDAKAQAASFDSLEALLLRKVDSLAELARRVAKTASVLGDRFPEDLLPVVEPELDEAELGAALEELERDEIVERDAAGFVAFADALLRQVVYESLPAEARIPLHRAAGRHLDRAHRDLLDERAEQAYRAEEWKKAVPLLERAARRAHKSLLLRTALVDLERLAKAFAKIAKPAPRAIELRKRGALLEAEIRMLVGELDRARELLLGERDQAGDDLAHAMKVDDLLGQIATRRAKFEEVLEHAASVIRLATETGTDENLGLGLLLQAGAHARMGNLNTAEEEFRRSIELLERTKNKAALARALQSYGLCLYYLGRPRESLGASSRAVRVARATGIGAWVSRALVNRALAEEELRQRGRAERSLQEAVSRLKGAGISSLLAYAYGNLNALAYGLGQLDEAIRLSRLQIDCFRHLGSPEDLGYPYSFLATIYQARGERSNLLGVLEELEGLSRDLPGDATTRIETCLTLVRGLWEDGQRQRARELVERIYRSVGQVEVERRKVVQLVMSLISGRSADPESVAVACESPFWEDRVLGVAAQGAPSLYKMQSIVDGAMINGSWLAALEALELMACFSSQTSARDRASKKLQLLAEKLSAPVWLQRVRRSESTKNMPGSTLSAWILDRGSQDALTPVGHSTR